MSASPERAIASVSRVARAARSFVFARHAESRANTAHVLSSNPARQSGLTELGARQARLLGEQLAHFPIDQAVCTRFLRTRQTVDIALRGRSAPLLVEPYLDEVDAGVFDGAPIASYWTWKEQHRSNEAFPEGESLDDALRRYAAALWRLLQRDERVTLVVCHELALRHIIAAAGGADSSVAGTEVAHAIPYLFHEQALRRAVAGLEALTCASHEPGVRERAARPACL